MSHRLSSVWLVLQFRWQRVMGIAGDDDEGDMVRSQCARHINGTTFSQTNIKQRAIEDFLVNSADATAGSVNRTNYLEPVVLQCRRKVRSNEIVVLNDEDLPDAEVCPLKPLRTVSLLRMTGKA